MSTNELPPQTDPLDQVLRIGAQMANVCFNWSQEGNYRGATLDGNERNMLGNLRKEWDAARAALASAQPSAGGVAFVDIVFDGPPSHESGRFVEVEDATGKSIRFGKWTQRPDGYWVLRIATPSQPSVGGGATWDAAQIKRPGWDHVEAAFIEGAREAKANPRCTDADIRHAADGHTKRAFEEVDPASEAALRTESWATPSEPTPAAAGSAEAPFCPAGGWPSIPRALHKPTQVLAYAMECVAQERAAHRSAATPPEPAQAAVRLTWDEMDAVIARGYPSPEALLRSFERAFCAKNRIPLAGTSQEKKE